MSEWWDYGSQVNAMANACAANQAAQVEALSLNHGKRIAELEAENARLRAGPCEKGHEFELLVSRDAITCKRCPLEVTGETLAAAGFRRRESGPIQQRANALADECGRLRDENTQLLAENARLRRGKR